MKKLEEMTLKQLKRRKNIFEVLGFTASVLPVAIVILMKWEVYTKDGGGIKLGAGAILLAAVLAFGIAGRLKLPGDIWVALFILVSAYLLDAVLDDLILLTAMYVAGRLLDRFLFRWYLKRVREAMEARRKGEIAGKAVLDGIKEYLGGVDK